MSENSPGGFRSIADPYWSEADYLRLAEHEAPEVRLWTMQRLEDLGLEIPGEVLGRRLQDSDRVVAGTAAMLIGERGVSGLADALLEQLRGADDTFGGACAVALAELGDGRALDFLRRQCARGPLATDPRVWLALSTLKGPEASRLLREAFEQIPPRADAEVASVLAEAYLESDPQGAMPLVIDRWLECPDGEEADTLLDALLSAADFEDGAEEFREAMRADRESSWPGLHEATLATLSQHAPFRVIGDASRACRKGKWPRLVEALLPIADWLEAETGGSDETRRALVLTRALGAQRNRLELSRDRARDASAMMLLDLTRISRTVRARAVTFPRTAEDRLRWLLSDAADPYPDLAATILDQLRVEQPTDAWMEACIRAIEARTEQAIRAAELLAAWRAASGVAALAGALGDREDPELAAAAGDALAEIGDAAVDAVLERLGSTEDPVLIEECLNVCTRLPS